MKSPYDNAEDAFVYVRFNPDTLQPKGSARGEDIHLNVYAEHSNNTGRPMAKLTLRTLLELAPRQKIASLTIFDTSNCRGMTLQVVERPGLYP